MSLIALEPRRGFLPPVGPWLVVIAPLALALIVATLAFSGSLHQLALRWYSQEEYSHGFLIPMISGWLIWRDRNAIASNVGDPAWTGLVLIGVGATCNVLGELAATSTISHVGFVIAVAGIALAAGGLRLLRATAAPIVLLFFAIPLPSLLDFLLSFHLQLISSELAGTLIRSLGIPVFVDGNIIDLGTYKLEVAEACSGLRYLFPLMSLGFVAACLFNGPAWQRCLVFASTVPITILMNTVRIGLIAVLTTYWGRGAAEGFLHAFEGWLIFVVCLLALLAEMTLLARFSGRRAVLASAATPEASSTGFDRQIRLSMPLAAGLIVLLASGGIVAASAARPLIIPPRAPLLEFPTRLGDWRGSSVPLEPEVERALAADDYLIANYTNGPSTVNVLLAYFASHSSGGANHTPRRCIPGGGWIIVSSDSAEINDVNSSFPVNRLVIQRGSERSLVYYWFEQGGRRLANEWTWKWHLIGDALSPTRRTDMAIVRLITPIYRGEGLEQAEGRIRDVFAKASDKIRKSLPERGKTD